MKIRKLTLLFLFQSAIICGFAQSVGIGTTSPNASAQLEVSSINKGMLMPRMTTAQRKAIVNPAPGLMVYDIDKKTILFFGGTKWNQLIFSESEISGPQTREIDTGEANDNFGSAVSLDGDYAVAGAYMDDVAGKTNQGSVIVFHRINGEWAQEAQLFAADGAAGDHFGYSVSISGNYIVVGTPDDDVGAIVDQGSVYVFARNGNNWTQQHKFIKSGGAANDHFGFSISMAFSQFVVGCPDDDIGANSDQGSATVFLLTGSTWTEEIILTAIDGASSHHFGFSVAITGGNAIIGSPGIVNPAGGNGAAYIYIKAVNWGFLQKLLPSNNSSGFTYGKRVAIEGTTAVVSQDFNNAFIVYGTVYVYLRGALSIWSQQAFIDDPSSISPNIFGQSISISGDQLVIGTSNRSGSGALSAHVSIYKRTGTVWQEQNTLYNGNPADNGNFGDAVFISGFNVIIGAPNKKNNKGEVNFINIE